MERERLIEYLDTHCVDTYGELQTWQVADFIILDRKNMVEKCVKIAEHQKTICGLSMSRQSTAQDIADNIRKIKV